ncbi:MAG: NAD-dependent epimerase/dehydratase family protein [Candidatus Yanofskybacteria bacterium]|nr:NAD-dependent epimerase/dehydratase family protein [Candidatus Yanofskybacteria bacterium]
MDLKNKNILVTGAKGFLGKHVLKGLTDKGFWVYPFQPSELTETEGYDLRSQGFCRKLIAEACWPNGPNVVIHLAGKVGGIGFNQAKPAELFVDNMLMGINMLEISRQLGVRKFVLIGTVCSYPKYTPIPFKEEDLWNGYPEETNAPYGIAKKALFEMARAYHQQYGFNAICLLPVNLYGPGDHFESEKSHVIPALIKKVADAQKNGQDFIEVWGTGNASREFLYVEDAAEAIVLATQHYDKPEPVNIGAGFEITIRELVWKICQIMDFKGDVKF